jgi:NAD-dependent SIR2 family protein deacetylase
MRDALPNAGHRALAALERSGVVRHVITQNVDRLHRKGGSRSVTELHGALAEVACLACHAVEDRDALQARILAMNPLWGALDGTFGPPAATAGPFVPSPRIAPDGDAELDADVIREFAIPACTQCGGVLKPRVVFFGDNVPRATVEEAYDATDAAQVLLVVGTSLAVFSGYRFLRRAVERNIPVAIVNRGPVRGETHASLKVEAGTGVTLEALARELGALSDSDLRTTARTIAREQEQEGQRERSEDDE